MDINECMIEVSCFGKLQRATTVFPVDIFHKFLLLQKRDQLKFYIRILGPASLWGKPHFFVSLGITEIINVFKVVRNKKFENSRKIEIKIFMTVVVSMATIQQK